MSGVCPVLPPPLLALVFCHRLRGSNALLLDDAREVDKQESERDAGARKDYLRYSVLAFDLSHKIGDSEILRGVTFSAENRRQKGDFVAVASLRAKASSPISMMF